MKRMNEVFELPVIGSELEWRLSETTMHEDAAIAHAINNVDALADALAACVKALGNMPAGDPVNDSDRAYHQAFEALAAYRGAK